MKVYSLDDAAFAAALKNHRETTGNKLAAYSHNGSPSEATILNILNGKSTAMDNTKIKIANAAGTDVKTMTEEGIRLLKADPEKHHNLIKKIKQGDLDRINDEPRILLNPITDTNQFESILAKTIEIFVDHIRQLDAKIIKLERRLKSIQKKSAKSKK